MFVCLFIFLFFSLFISLFLKKNVQQDTLRSEVCLPARKKHLQLGFFFVINSKKQVAMTNILVIMNSNCQFKKIYKSSFCLHKAEQNHTTAYCSHVETCVSMFFLFYLHYSVQLFKNTNRMFLLQLRTTNFTQSSVVFRRHPHGMESYIAM